MRVFSNKNIEVNEEKVDVFVNWFIQNQERIKESTTNPLIMMKVLDEVEDQLALIYRDGFKGDIEFNYGGDKDEWNLFLFHLNNKFLMKATELIATKLNANPNCLFHVYIDE